MSARVRRPGLWFGGGLALAAVLATVVLFSLTGSGWGREQILGYTLKVLGGRLNGTLTVDRVEGDLFTGARLFEVAVLEADGTPLLTADSAWIEYRVATFLGGDVVIDYLVLFQADVRLRRLPGDSLWNYQRLLQDTSATAGQGPPRATLIRRLVVVDGEADIRLPWEPTPGFSPAERRAETVAALADTSRLMVEAVPNGYLRTILVDADSAALGELTIAGDERGGNALAIDAFRGEIRLWDDPPLRVVDARGALAIREGVLTFDAPLLRLPGSAVAAGGRVDLTEEEPRYDVVVAGTGVQLADLQWLLPALPDRGTLAGRLWLETRPEGLLYLARGLDVRAPDSRVVGDLGIVVGDTVRFTEADLRARPLDLRTIRDLLPPSVPVDQLRLGELVIETPAS